MELSTQEKVVYQTVILNEREVNLHLEEFLEHINRTIPLETISKDNAKCVGNHIINGKQAKKIKLNSPTNTNPEKCEHFITFAFHENHEKDFLETTKSFWTGKN